VTRGEIDVRAFIVLACLSVAATPAAGGGETVHAPPEARLIAALDNMYRGAFDAALADLGELIERQPNFQLAHYLQDELRSRRADRPFNAALDRNGGDGQRRALVDEALLRWSHHLSAPPPGAVPNAVLQLARPLRHVVVVDLLRHRLYLWRNEGGDLTLVADFYASIGRAGIGKRQEGDLRTPVGVYHVTDFKPDETLPELYGDGAFPVNYPNGLDRVRGRTGYGIWVHGVPRDTYSRPPRASEGCVVIANSDLRMLRRHLRPGLTPVVFTDELRWLTADQAEVRRRELAARLEERAAGVDPADVSIFRYPGETETVMVDFLRRPPGDDPRAVTRKQEFWRHDPAAGWRVVYAASAE
jgi:hypothetical protein